MKIVVDEIFIRYDTEPLLFVGHLTEHKNTSLPNGLLFFLKDDDNIYLAWNTTKEIADQVAKNKITVFDSIHNSVLEFIFIKNGWEHSYHDKNSITERLPEKGVYLVRQ